MVSKVSFCYNRFTFNSFPFPGIKTFVNEFVAYTSLSGMIKNTDAFYNLTYNYNATWSHTGDLDITVHATNLTQETVLTDGYLSVSYFINMPQIGRYGIILLLDSCQQHKWRVKSATHNVIQMRIQHQSLISHGQGDLAPVIYTSPLF